MSYYKSTSLWEKIKKVLQLFLLSYRTPSEPVRRCNRKAFAILMVVPQFDRIGGYELQAAQLARSLTESGHLVTIVTDKTRQISARELRNGFLIRRMPAGKLATLFALYYFLLTHARTFDVVHAHGITGFSLFAIQVAAWIGIPTTLKVPTAGDVNSLHEARRMKNVLYSSFFRAARKFIAVSEQIKQELQNAGIEERQIAMIPNFVNTAFFRECDGVEKEKIRSSLQIPDGKTLFLYLGRLEKRKGVDLLLEAWKNQGILWIVGSGPEETALRKKTAELELSNVQFVGSTSNPLKYYQSADVMVLPSSKEGAANVLLEAMSCGLPVIATRIGGTLDQIEHQRHGLLIASGSVAELSEALEYMTAHPQERQSWGRAAQQQMREKFDVSKITAMYVDLYSQLASVPSSKPAPSAE